MKHLQQKKLWSLVISTVVLCLIAGSITASILFRKTDAVPLPLPDLPPQETVPPESLPEDVPEDLLEERQQVALQELQDNQGQYDEQQIVLSNTTQPRAEDLAKTFGAELRITEDGSFATLTLPEGTTVFDIYENDDYRKYIEYMSLDYQAKISDLLPNDEAGNEVPGERLPIRPQYTVSDTDYNRQTYLDYLNMSNVWNKTKGKGITVAVIDTGIDTDHPEFAGRISEYSYNASEDKIVKDYVLADGSCDWSLVEDEQGHGTAVAGVIAASMDGNGVVGIAPQVNIIVIKAECNESGTFKRTSDLVFGLYYAIERDVAVVNMSFGTTDPNNPFAEPAQLAFDSDVICVAAAGNGATAQLHYPAADENVFGIGALAQDSWELATYSNYGENVDFVAPGTVYTTLMGGGYGGMNGTSFASPITAGVLALYMSQNKYAEFNTVEELLYASCYDLGDLGPDWYYGYGALDVSALILEERGTVTFNMMTDELENTEQVFIRTHTLQNMPEPERLYAIFDGWYYDPQCTEEYVWYEDEFHSDLTLYANWVNEDDGIPYTYVELEDGTIEIRSYTGHRRYITIPDYIDGKVVSSIGEFAFKGETRLREVKLPKYLKRIRMSAFSGCSNLVAMEIPDTVTEIGENAFFDNVRLSTLTFGQNSQLVSIGDYAFSGCAKMRTFTVPSKVTSLNATAFYSNTAMIAYDVQAGNTSFTAKNGVLFNYTGSSLVCYPAGLSGTYTVPENVQSIADYAFAFTRLNGVELSGVQTLGASAFIYGSLESVVIPDSVTSMGASVFAYNSYMRSATLGTGLISIPSSTFTLTALTSIEIPANIRSIGGNAFASTNLTSIEIPAGIRSINDRAFANIDSLTEVTFAPDSTLTYIGQQAFFDSGVISVEIPASVVTIGGSAFGALYCPNLSTLTFEENSSLHTIGGGAFGFQHHLTAVDLPDSLTNLGDYAFRDTGLATIDIPASVSYLGEGVFASCHSLTDIFVDNANPYYLDVDGVVYNTSKTTLVAYPAGNTRASYNILEEVTDIGEASFYGCIIQSVYCNQNLVTIHSKAFQDAWLQNIYFQEGLKSIRPYAFYNTQNIERIDLPDSVEILDEYSFCGCGARQYGLSKKLREIKQYALSMNPRLTTIAIPDSVIQISHFAFFLDRSLHTVTFTENAKLPRISYGAFAYCGLTSFRVPASISTMAQGAFEGCSKLTSFTFAKNSKLESISAYMFDGCSSLKTITFEKGSALTSIQAHGLEGMRKLTSIDFGDANLQNIDNFAFRFCESLTRFDIPDGVTFLGRYAFYYCTNLSEVTVPSTMDFIGRFAFLGTKDLNVYFASETLPVNLAEDWDHGITGYYLGVTDVITEGDWTYAKLTSGNIAIIKYNGTATELDLTTLNLGGEIVNIGGGAFADNAVERIVLPDTLQIIQAEAFYHSELKSVSIPASVTFIGRSAFAYTPIETLTFASNAQVKTIEQSAFEKTEKLGSVTIPASVTTMGRAVFKNSGITSLTFADGFSMAEIPEEAFAYTHISTVTIPDSVTLINHNAFREIKELKSVTLGCGEELMIMSNVFYQSGLESVYLPENVGYVGEYAFVGLSKLTEFKVSENNPYYKAVDGLLVSKNGRKLIAVPSGRTGSLTVPEDIEVIGFGAFEDSKLSEIKFLDNANILSFGYRAFYNADSITEMHIPASVVAIDYYAFAMCDNLQTVTFAEDNNLKGVYEGAFYGCKNLSDIMLPDSIVEISEFAFYGCRSLTDVPVSETSEIKGIYDYAFAYAGFSGDYTTPETLIDIGPYAFMGNKFTSVTIPDTNYWDLIIGIGAFEECNDLAEITVPFIGASFEDDEITWFGYIFGAGRYEANTNYVPEALKKVTISEGITFVGKHAFDGLTELDEICIPHSVQLIYVYAFEDTTAKYELTNIITTICEYNWQGYIAQSTHFGIGISGQLQLSDRVTSIDNRAFSGCTGLTSVIIGNGVTSINYRAFYNCSGLKNITIPDSITSIVKEAFYGCSALCLVDNHSDLPLTIGSTDYGYIAYYAQCIIDKSGDKTYPEETYIETSDGFLFTYNGEAYQLIAYLGTEDTVTLPKDINGNSYQILKMRGIKNVIIPEGITTIGYQAFSGCTTLTSVTIGNGATSIGEYAFENCSNLTNITIPDSVTSIGSSAFSHCSSLTSITIPDGMTSIGYSAFLSCSSLSSVTIPDSITSIGNSAFAYCSSLATVTISNNITSIGSSVFSYCKSLKNVTIPSGVKSIGKNAFQNCSSLTSIIIPDSVTSIGSAAFSACSNLTNIQFSENHPKFTLRNGIIYDKTVTRIVYVPDSVENVCIPATITNISSAFQGNKNIKEVSFETGSQIKTIGANAFANCINLTSIDIPDTVTRIDVKAFYGCKSLTNIIIPGSVSIIGERAFMGCSNLTNVTIFDGVNCIDIYAFSSCNSLQNITIPDSVTYIYDKAFYGCDNLTSVIIGKSVTGIGQNVFDRCENLESITIPESLKGFDYGAFNYCYRLKNVYYEGTLEQWCNITFSDSTANPCHNGANFYINGELVVNMVIPNSVTSIGEYAFSGCNSLMNVIIGDGITSIRPQAFSYCKNLISITLPDSVTSIGNQVFYGCSSLKSITIPDSITSIGNQVFYGCSSLTSINIPDSITSIGDQAFYECNSMTNIIIPDSLTSIGNQAFYGCLVLRLVENHSNLPLTIGSTDYGYVAYYAKCVIDKSENKTYPDETYIETSDGFLFTYIDGVYQLIAYMGTEDTVTLPKSINGTSYQIFKMQGVKNVIIPDGVLSIDNQAFYGCTHLMSVTIPDSVTVIGKQAFYGCTNLTSVTIPDSVTSIGEQAFYGCTGMVSITISNGVTNISDNSFYGCASLASVAIPNGVTSIGSAAFFGCSSLTAVTIPNSVTSIGTYAFFRCSSLTSITIPDSVTSISSLTFSQCSSLKNVTIPNSVTSIGLDAFAYCYNMTSITIPDSIVKIGDYAFYCCNNLTNIIIPNSVTSVGQYAFSGCNSLTSITIPPSVTRIESGAFADCLNLTSITFTDDSQVTSIGPWAFSGCRNLTSITIPDSVTTISAEAFLNCYSLTSITIPDGVTTIYERVITGTAYYNDPANWENGALYIGNHLIFVSEDTKYLILREKIASVAYGSYNNCNLLKNAVVKGDQNNTLSTVTNLETLAITEMPAHDIYQYFGYSSNSIPLTLKSIVLGKDVRMNKNAFYGITGITIYVEADEKDVRWDENYPGWNNGNKVVYGDDWITADFYDQNGNLISSEIFLTHQVIRQPYLELVEDLEESQVLVGWDLDGDGIPDTIPATSSVDIEARPIIETRASEYTVSFFDADGETLISKVVLPYGAEIVAPVIEEQMGYTTNGWIGYIQGMTVSGNHVFVLDRVHNGGGHEYAEPIWIAPTCTERGYNKHVCKICGEHYETDHTDAVGHTYKSSEVPATCTKEGVVRYTCETCGHEYSEMIPANGHNYVGTVTKKATCTKYGELLFVCEHCGDRVSEKAPMVAHNYQKRTVPKWWLQILIEKILNVFFGYEGDNIFYYECVDCKHIQTAEESTENSGVAGVQSAACAHQLSDWTEYIAPTCEGEGVDAKFCTICEKAVEFRRGADAWGHAYSKHIVTDPTCTEEGYTTHTCSRCGDTYTDSETPALGHTAGAEADCLNDQVCTVCGEVLIEKLGHDYVAVVTAPTCTEEGYTTHTCSRCGDTYTDSETPALGHTAGTEADCLNDQICTVCGVVLAEKLGHDYVAVVTAPTCTEKGYTTHTCSRCGDTYTDSETPALGHTAGTEADCLNDQICTVCGVVLAEKLGHDYVAVVTAPTCTEEGYTTNTCTRCADTYIDNEVAELGHKPGAEADCLNDQVCTVCGVVLAEKLGHDYVAVVTAPTCTEKGYTTHTCSRCNDAYTDSETPALGHTAGAEADCLNDQVCTVCGEVLIEKLGHDYVAVVTAPTCTEEGYTTHTCSRCNNAYIDSETPALGHTAGVDADCLNDQVCTVCGVVLAEKLGHDYVAEVTAPTCIEEGYTTHTCSRCGDSYTDTVVEALGHTAGEWITDQEPAPKVEGSKHTECTICGEVLETVVIEALPAETVPETEPATSPETNMETNTESETSVTADTFAKPEPGEVTEKVPAKSGCSGNIYSSISLLALVVLVLPLAVRRKKETE